MMKTLNYILFVALAAIMMSCSDNDSQLMASGVGDVTGEVVFLSYDEATIKILSNKSESESFNYHLVIKNLTTGKLDSKYGYEASKTIQGHKIEATWNLSELDPDCEYEIYFEYESHAYIPLIKLLTFKTLKKSAQPIFTPRIAYSLIEDSGAVIKLEFPRKVGLWGGKVLISEDVNMNNPMVLRTISYDDRVSTEHAIGLGRMLAPDTKYFLQIKGSFFIGSDYTEGQMDDDSNWIDNASTIPVEFTTNSTHIGIFDGGRLVCTDGVFYPWFDTREVGIYKLLAYEIPNDKDVDLYNSDKYDILIPQNEKQQGVLYYPILRFDGKFSDLEDNEEFHIETYVVPNPRTIMIESIK